MACSAVITIPVLTKALANLVTLAHGYENIFWTHTFFIPPEILAILETGISEDDACAPDNKYLDAYWHSYPADAKLEDGFERVGNLQEHLAFHREQRFNTQVLAKIPEFGLHQPTPGFVNFPPISTKSVYHRYNRHTSTTMAEKTADVTQVRQNRIPKRGRVIEKGSTVFCGNEPTPSHVHFPVFEPLPLSAILPMSDEITRTTMATGNVEESMREPWKRGTGQQAITPTPRRLHVLPRQRPRHEGIVEDSTPGFIEFPEPVRKRRSRARAPEAGYIPSVSK